MFSGITRGLFTVTHVEKKPALTLYTVALNPELLLSLELGASVAIDGVCQTVVAIKESAVTFHAIQNTLDKTTLNELYQGRKVSVERSVCYGEEIGGHEISGHITGTAEIKTIDRSENNLTLTLSFPHDWLPYILAQGFIAVDGSSLTVGEVREEGTFTVHLIPETLRLTNFANKQIGDRVNIELDYKTRAIVATVERILAARNLLTS